MKKHSGLRPRQVFGLVSKEGKRLSNPLFIFRYLNLSPGLTPRDPRRHFSVAVSSKIVPKATLRNLLKRRVRAVVSQSREKLKNNYCGIFYIKSGALKVSFKELKESVLETLERATIIKR